MEEQKQEVKKGMPPDQAQTKHIRSMSDRQLSNRVKNLARSKTSDTYLTRWATVLDIVLNSKVRAYLR